MWKPRPLGVCVLVSLLALSESRTGQASSPSQSGSTSDATPVVIEPADPYWKVRGPLRDLLPSDDAPVAAPSTLDTSAPALTLGNLIGVTIRTLSLNQTLDALFGLGRLVGNMRDNVIEVYLPLSDIITLASRPEIVRIEAIVPATPLVTTQGQSVHNASNWIAGGIRGSGVKIGVIDTGFQGIQSLIGTEIPTGITARCYTLLGVFTPLLLTCENASTHGTAVLESLYDMAPGAQFYISQPVSRLDFANTVDWMLSQGVSVINYSASWVWDGPGDGTSPYSDSPLRAVDSAVARGATVVVAAGNSGLATWFGPWRDTDSDNVHEFSTTTASELNRVTLAGGQRIELQLRWQSSWTAAATDLDLALVDGGGNVVSRSAMRQSSRPGDTPSEYFSTVAPVSGQYYVKVTRIGGPLPAWIQVQAYNFVPLQFATGASIGNPAESANPGVLTVGAASWATTSTIEPYSSIGPTPDGRIKPDIVGADQGATVTYGNFGGTSQAAPHVAGLAALVKSAFPAFTPQQVASYLTSNALARGASRPNNTWGSGFAKLPNLCSTTVTPATASVSQAGGQLQFAVSTLGSCAWSASSQAPWLTIASGASGVGSGAVLVHVAANAGAPRTSTLVIANTGVTIAQDGPGTAATNPRNLVASVSGTVATLTWLPPESGTPTGYVFEAGTQSGLADLITQQMGSGLSVSFEATSGLYFARVRASFGGGTSPPSNEVSFRIGPAPPGPGPGPGPGQPGPGVPTAPLNFGAAVSSRNVLLSWAIPTSGVNGLSTFVIEAGTAPGLSNLAVINIPALSLFVPDVPLGTYYLRVRAANGSGMGPPSNEVVLVVSSNAPPPPGSPTNVGSAVIGTTVTVQWQPPSTGGAPTGYGILVGSSPGLSNIAAVPIGLGTSFTATGVPHGVYFLRMVAINATGASPPSNEIVIVVPGS